jgi:hypothetical protein
MISSRIVDNTRANAGYVVRPQPDATETDPDVLHDHVEVLRGELASVTGLRRKVRMRNETDARVLHEEIGRLNEQLADAYLARAGTPAQAHTSECAINQAPAYRPGPCNCGAVQRNSSAVDATN